MSPHFTRRIEPGATVYLGGVEGTFGLPDPLPPKLLFVSAGSGITPIMSMLRELERRDALADVVHVHCERRAESVIFADLLDGMAERHPGYVRHAHFTESKDRLGPAAIAELCDDWRDRYTLASGPGEMLDAIVDHWEAEGDPDLLNMERFQPTYRTGGDAEVGRAARSASASPTSRRPARRASRSWSAASRPGPTSPTAAGWGSATPASASSPRGG